ncbi:MAG TPA: MarR family transcriptional regulator [Dehalococcoidia bacterium]|nr:MarR family transcriptional regulator [Dehalococcoidia bacterium]
MTERSVHDLARWYSERSQDTDELSFEVHLMLLRTYSLLTTGSQFEVRGGLSRARYNVLRILHQAPEERLTMSDIVEGLNVSPTNITKLVDGLTSEGLVRRVGHSEDKRKTWAELTDEGRRVVEMAIPGVSAHTGWLWAGLNDEEKRVLIHLLAKMRLHAATAGATGVVSKLSRQALETRHAEPQVITA